jgi:SAM-dependent methyltransferase
MLIDPAQYARFPFRQDHLRVLYMDGLHLDFPDNHFDFAFSFSSIEHFGGHAASAKAVAEMARVVRPGGAVVLTTEVVLNGIADEEYFLPAEIDAYLLAVQDLRPIEDIDYSLSEKTMAGFVDTAEPDFIYRVPHIVLKRGYLYYTSICLVLEKLKPGLI